MSNLPFSSRTTHTDSIHVDHESGFGDDVEEDTLTPAIFQNPEEKHYNNGFVNCFITKTGSKITFSYIMNYKQIGGRNLRPLLVAEKKHKLFPSSKFHIFESPPNSANGNSYLGGNVKNKKQDHGTYLGYHKKGKHGAFDIKDGSDIFTPPNLVATFLLEPSSTKAHSYKRRSSQGAICRGASCGTLLQELVDDALETCGVNKFTFDEADAFPELVYVRIIRKKKIVVMKDYTGQEVLRIKDLDYRTIGLQYRAPFNAFQAFGAALAHWSTKA